MEILDLDRAEYELNKAYKSNPTPWAEHSRYVAKAARIIASEYNKKSTDKKFSPISKIKAFSQLYSSLFSGNRISFSLKFDISKSNFELKIAVSFCPTNKDFMLFRINSAPTTGNLLLSFCPLA